MYYRVKLFHSTQILLLCTKNITITIKHITPDNRMEYLNKFDMALVGQWEKGPTYDHALVRRVKDRRA